MKACNDEATMGLLPKDISSDLYPVQVQADGNSLPRYVSLIAYGDQEMYVHMKVRLAAEIIPNKDQYKSVNRQYAAYSKCSQRDEH